MFKPDISFRCVKQQEKHIVAYLLINNESNIAYELKRHMQYFSNNEIYCLLTNNLIPLIRDKLLLHNLNTIPEIICPTPKHMDKNINYSISFKLPYFSNKDVELLTNIVNNIFPQFFEECNRIMILKTQNILIKCDNLLKNHPPIIIFKNVNSNMTIAEINMDYNNLIYSTMSNFMAPYYVFNIFEKVQHGYAKSCIDKLSKCNIVSTYDSIFKKHNVVELYIKQLSTDHRLIVSEICINNVEYISKKLYSKIYNNPEILLKKF